MIDGTSALQMAYINDIPWVKAPAFALGDNAQAYIDSFRRVLEVIPAPGMKIKFSDDVWDFRPYFHNVKSNDYVFHFDGLHPELADYLKFFVLQKISEKTKVSTVSVRYGTFVSMINHIAENTLHKTIHLITTQDIVDEIKRRNVSSSRMHSLYQSAYQVYHFLLNHYKLELPVDLNVLDEGSRHQKTLAKQNQEETKLPNIPEAYFNIILSRCAAVMRDVSAEHDYRMMAAAVVLLSQIGLRLGDLLALTTHALQTKTLAKSGNTAHYIHFSERKPSKAHQPLLEFDIFCTPIGAEAFQIMKSIRTNSPMSNGNDFLFVLSNFATADTAMPHSKVRFRSVYRRFFYKFIPEAQREWEGIDSCTYTSNPYGVKKGTMSPVNLSIPDTRQFRVHLCTSLYEQGVPLVYIQKYMGHLSEYMLGYYVRPKDTYQENIKYSEKVIREIAQDGVIPLGGSLIGSEVKANILKFIEDNGFNVQTDIEAIVKALGDKVIIRGKTGGVCIKTSIIPCSQDARTNEMLCAYNLCPNLFHFYYMIDVTYLNFKTLQDTYRAMKNAGQTKAAQKELAKLRDLINRRLEPELDELDREIQVNGSQTIMDRYPALIDIVESRGDIRKEIDEWRT